MYRWMGITGALLMVSSIGCANPANQAQAPTKSIQWAPETMMNSMAYPDGCPSMQQIQQNLPQQIPAAEASSCLTNIDTSQIQSTAPMNPDVTSYSTSQWRGRIGRFGRFGGLRSFGLFGGSWFSPYAVWPYAYSSFMYYPYGNLYYPYYNYNNYYYPAYYYYNPLSYGAAAYNPYYVYPFYYRTAGIYRPYFYTYPSLLWRNRFLRF